MSYSIAFRSASRRDYEGLPAHVRTRVRYRVDGLAVEPRPHDAEELTGPLRGLRRVPVGAYRIVYEVDDLARKVTIWAICHRSRVYPTVSRRLQ